MLCGEWANSLEEMLDVAVDWAMRENFYQFKYKKSQFIKQSQ